MAELFSGKEKKEMQKAIKKYFPVFVLPTMIAFTIGFIAPFLLGIYLSFCKFTTVTDAEFIGLGNYIKTLGDAEFIHSLWYTALYTVVTVLLINVLAFAVAMLLTKGIKGTNIFRTVFFMPNLIGGIVLGISGIQNIPGELIEAAKIDGANSWQILKNVTIPMVMPSITICTFLTLTNGFKLFDQNLALTNGAPSKMSELLALNIYNTFYGRAGWEGVGQAKAVEFFVLVAIIALIQNKLTRSKEVQQ